MVRISYSKSDAKKYDRTEKCEDRKTTAIQSKRFVYFIFPLFVCNRIFHHKKSVDVCTVPPGTRIPTIWAFNFWINPNHCILYNKSNVIFPLHLNFACFRLLASTKGKKCENTNSARATFIEAQKAPCR